MLNKKQKQAVKYNQGPLLIIAGAGTGKTTVIVEKIKYLIKKKLAKPEEILALTFTEKAAYEMEERVDKEIPYGYFQMWISTFHSFADQILKERAHHIGINPDFRLMNEAETVLFLKKNLFFFDFNYFQPLSNPNKFINNLIDHFSRLKDEDISPEEYLNWAKSYQTETKEEKDKYLELANAYKIYEDLKIKNGVLDYSDLIYYLLKLFRHRKNLLLEYQQRFKYVLIDEFQDTNITQYELIKIICPPNKNPKLTVVGDDSQAIYKFRGASISNILNFMNDYPQAKQITLLKNYRSNQEILNAAYKLIKNNDPDTLEAKLGISKKLISVKKKPQEKSIFLFLGNKVEEEVDFVVKKILKLKKSYQYSDFAILCRANNHANPFIRGLIQNGIPYQFLGPGFLFKQPEIKDLIAYLKFLSNVDDSVSLYRVLSMNIFDIDPKDISLLLAFSKKISQSLFQSIEIYLSFFDDKIYQKDYQIYKKYLPLLSEKTKKTLLFIYSLIKKHLSLIKKETAGQILYFFLEETGYLKKITNYKSEKEEKIALNISKFFNYLKNFEMTNEDASVFAVVDFLEMSIELGESPTILKTDIENYNAVNILTVHSAKGLEFPVVFLVNLTKGRFPTNEKKEKIPIPEPLIKEILPQGNYHLQEERRLFYVGLTRAKDKIFLTASKFYGEGIRQQKLSPFVYETLEEKYFLKEENQIINNNQWQKYFQQKKSQPVSQKQQEKTNYFSYTQLETYDKCPLQYKYQFILKIPTSPSANLSFGETIHKTLQQFYQRFLENKNIDSKEIIKIYEKNWIPVGYNSKIHEQRAKKEGALILENYLKKFHHKDLKIIFLEKKFKLKIKDDVFIIGKIDRIDKIDNQTIEIIDYKTGKIPEKNDLEKNLQLLIYGLAINDKKISHQKIENIIFSLIFLNKNEKFSITKKPEELIKIKDIIYKKIEEIKTSDFKPKVSLWCDFCPFKIICEAWQ